MSDSGTPLIRSSGQSPGLRQHLIDVLLGRASMVVRETGAEELEERRADWGYTKPSVALDMLLNIAIVVVAVVMLLISQEEKPNVPIRIWICGYALQCLVHMVLVWSEFRKRNANQRGGDLKAGEGSVNGRVSHDTDDEDGDERILSNMTCETINTIISFVWWIVGYYWLESGGDILLKNASHLYWLTYAFLAFDVFFAVFCVALAFLTGIALCCYLFLLSMVKAMDKKTTVGLDPTSNLQDKAQEEKGPTPKTQKKTKEAVLAINVKKKTESLHLHENRFEPLQNICSD